MNGKVAGVGQNVKKLIGDIKVKRRLQDIIKRKPNALSSILTGQFLAAFHGRPDIAYHKKTKIWEDDNLYMRYFNEHIGAKHIIFSYSLF